MHDLPCKIRRGLVTALLTAATAVPIDTVATQAVATRQDDENTHVNDIGAANSSAVVPAQAITSPNAGRGLVLTAPNFAPLFTTPEDAHAYWDMLVRSYTWTMFDPRTVAKSFIRQRMGIDGDKYVVAHFASTQKRMEGSADNVTLLTDALMNAFPEHSRHSFFGAAADTIGGLSSGGKKSPSTLSFFGSLLNCGAVSECLSRTGRFLWSRTGPGYIYNTFIGEGNVVDTLREDARPLDAAFGIYPKSSTFLPEHVSPFLLSTVIDKFKEEGVFSELPYIKRLKAEFDKYWETGRTEWPVLVRYQFVHEARRALSRRVLTPGEFELVMKGGAPQVPLQGPITLRQLRNTPADASVNVRRLDINGYAATDILRFIASNGSEVMYIPGAPSPFTVFRNEGQLRQWVVGQARHRGTLDDLLSHFSIYNSQDGTVWTGVAQGLAHLADGRWTADGRAIDANNARIQGDVFEDMRVQVEARLRDDARMRTSTAWDAWRTTLNRTATVIGPVGYLPPLAIPVQVGSGLIGLGTGIDEGLNGRTTERRKSALENAVMTVVTNTTLAAAIGGPRAAGEIAEPPPPAVLPAPDSFPLMTAEPQSASASTTTSLSGSRLPETQPGVSMPEAATGSTSSPSQAAASMWEVLTQAGSPSSRRSEAEARVAYSMGSISPEWLSAVTRQTEHSPGEATPKGDGANDPLTPATAGTQPRREYDPRGTDPRTPFNLMAAEREIRRLGYLVQSVPSSSRQWVRRVIDLKKSDIDEARHRLDDFRTTSLSNNQLGYQMSFDHSLVFRVDSRTPRELLRKNGFGPSSQFNDLGPMLRQPSTIGSGSLRASNTVFINWQRDFPHLVNAPAFHQYAIWTERRPVVSASDNHDKYLYDYVLDEVHFPANVPARDIYIIDSFNPLYAHALARIYESRYVSTPYGVPLEAFEEYLTGVLDIDAPNRFSERRLTGQLPAPQVASSQSQITLETGAGTSAD